MFKSLVPEIVPDISPELKNYWLNEYRWEHHKNSQFPLHIKAKSISTEFGHRYNKEICLLFTFISLILGTNLFMQIFTSTVKF